MSDRRPNGGSLRRPTGSRAHRFYGGPLTVGLRSTSYHYPLKTIWSKSSLNKIYPSIYIGNIPLPMWGGSQQNEIQYENFYIYFFMMYKSSQNLITTLTGTCDNDLLLKLA